MSNETELSPIEIIRAKLDPTIVTRGRVVLIGLGGIGLWLANAIVTFLAGLRQALPPGEDVDILLCDGDDFGIENTYRMDVPDFGNKAFVLGQHMLDRIDCPGVNIRWYQAFIEEENAHDLIAEGNCVLLACDNHATRRLVSLRCQSLDNVVLISGGNDGVEDGSRGTYGNVQVYIRHGGRDATAALDKFHDAIANPPDELPSHESCTQLAAVGVPQLSIVNLAVASAMCNALLRLMMPVPGERMYDEVALDVLDAVNTPHWITGPQEIDDQGK